MPMTVGPGSHVQGVKRGHEMTSFAAVQLQETGANRFEALERLGAGSYGVVLKCRDSVMDSVVAVKRIKDIPETPQDLIRVLREAQILVQTPRHPNIVRCLDAYMSLTGRVYLVFEHVDRTLSRELLFKPKGLSSMSIKIIFWQLLNGTAFLHSRRIIHRDLKPANVLLTAKGVVKICDFGFACSMNESDEDNNVLAITRWYRAPEVLAEGEYGPGVDVWALGCILAELCTGVALLPGEDRIDQLRLIAGLGVGEFSEKQQQTIATDPHLARFVHPQPEEVPSLKSRMKDASPELLELLKACLVPDPLKRPSAAQLMEYSWLEGVDELVPEEALEALHTQEAEAPRKVLQPLPCEDVSDTFTFRTPSTEPIGAQDISMAAAAAAQPTGMPRARRGIVAPSPVYKPLMNQLMGEDKLLQVHAGSELGDDEVDGGMFHCDGVMCSDLEGAPMNSNDNLLLMHLAGGSTNDPGSAEWPKRSSTLLQSPSGRLHQSMEEFERVQEQLGDMGLEVVGRLMINNPGRVSPVPRTREMQHPTGTASVPPVGLSTPEAQLSRNQPPLSPDAGSRISRPQQSFTELPLCAPIAIPGQSTAQGPGVIRPLSAQPKYQVEPIHGYDYSGASSDSEEFVSSFGSHLKHGSPNFCPGGFPGNFFPSTPRLGEAPPVMPLHQTSITPGP